jgi:hypothetical protein
VQVFTFPPMLHLPGHLLSSVSSTTHLKPLHPSSHFDRFTSLILQHLDKATDVAIAGMIHHLPNLEHINLRGCTLASDKTIKTIIVRCKRLRRINLKGTKTSEANVKELLQAFGNQLTGFKVDNVRFDVGNKEMCMY